ncbi:MAG: hypothetical protein JO340_04780 [Acidobacteriaceae bacterium]|nr:hypothetical protein [Acidobacteriaceae bacterium]
MDRKNTYVFGVSPSAVLESVGKSLSYWSTGNGEDTMVTLWNPADEAQDFIFTLFFAGGQYALPLHLEGKVTRSFNISEIIANQIPDELGRTIPLAIHEGSAVLTGSQGESEHILVAMESGTYNVQKATCGSTHCKTCLGATESFIDSDPWGLPVSSSVQETFTAQYNTGRQFNLTSAASWTSGNTSIATVSAGKVAARAAGTTFVAANDPTTPDYTSGCYAYAIECPLETGQSAQAPGSVTADIQLNGTAISAQQPGSIVVGEQATLSASTGTGTIQTATWSVGGSTIGSWTPGSPPTTANFGQQSPSFYWIAGGSGISISVSGTLTDGTQFSGSASVNVSAPGFVIAVTAQPSSAIGDYSNQLTYGNSQGTSGITFQATNLSGSGCSLEWVQVIVESVATLKRSGTITYSSTTTASLDTDYPYADNTIATSDSPGWGHAAKLPANTGRAYMTRS